MNVINDKFSILAVNTTKINLLIYLINNNNDNSYIELFDYNTVKITYNDNDDTSKIDMNTDNISSNLGKIGTNENNISSNLEKIKYNEKNISSNLINMRINEDNIASNLTKINGISSNKKYL